MNSNYSRIQSLKKQRWVLGIAIAPQFICALVCVVMTLASQLEAVTGTGERLITSSLTPLDRVLMAFSGPDEHMMLFRGVLFPMFCIALLLCLLFLIRKNKDNPVIHTESIWIILLGCLLPWIIWGLDSFDIFYRIFAGINVFRLTAIWMLVGSVLLNVFVIRNFFQFTKAIRRGKSRS